MLRSLKSRLTFLYVGIFALFVIAFSLGVHALAAKRVWREFDRDLERDGQVFANLVLEELAEMDRGEHTPENWLDELRSYPESMHASATLYAADGKTLFRSRDLAADSLQAGGRPWPIPAGIRTEYLALKHRPGNYRIITQPIGDGRRPPMTLEFARSTDGLSRFLLRMGLELIGAVPLLMLLASMAGYFFVKRALRPVDEMAVLAREISAGDLARRIPIPSSEGEFRQLALTINAMLSRLEEAFARMRTFTANAAHELRTPISTIRTALETTVGRSPAEMEEAIRDALEELGRLSEITEKLFLLARADAGRLLGATKTVDLAELAGQIAEAFEGPAAAKDMTLQCALEPLAVDGDAALIRRAIHNLVENAVKYGRKGGKIRIQVGPAGLEVGNDGPAIAPEHLPRLFDRFYRIDPARSDRIPGAGLGLAIVKSIIEAHGGRLEVESTPQETIFRISLKGAGPTRPVAVPVK